MKWKNKKKKKLKKWKNKYLVDPASSHMLVLKIKPCMPKFRWIFENRDCGWLNKSVVISLVFFFDWCFHCCFFDERDVGISIVFDWITLWIAELIHVFVMWGKGKQWCFLFFPCDDFIIFCHFMRWNCSFGWFVFKSFGWMMFCWWGWFCDGIAFISFLKGILRTANVVFCVWWFLRLLWGIELICSCLILFIFWDVFWFFETKEWIGIFYWMMFFSFFFWRKNVFDKERKSIW